LDIKRIKPETRKTIERMARQSRTKSSALGSFIRLTFMVQI
jgi:hypothetical protein